MGGPWGGWQERNELEGDCDRNKPKKWREETLPYVACVVASRVYLPQQILNSRATMSALFFYLDQAHVSLHVLCA